MSTDDSFLVSRAYLLSSQEVLRRLRVHAQEGLSSREVSRRQKAFGLNELPKGRRGRILLLMFDRFQDVLVIILVLAAFISIAIGHTSDAFIIAVAIALDAGLSFLQVWRTERTLAKMRQQIQDTIRVIRNGKSVVIPSSQLVPGDLIELQAGERIPADARLVSAKGIRTQEAALTGESSDVDKTTAALDTRTPVSNQTNMVFTGTTVVTGTGLAVVVHTRTQTEFGKIATLLRNQKSPDSPLRRKLQQKGTQIGWGIIGAVILLTLIGIFKGEDSLTTIRTSITLAVSAIPEDLTMILTIALTVGVARILRQGGVVRTLSSGETLGAATVICTDKTGTLTEGTMQALELDFLQGDHLTRMSEPDEQYHILALQGLALATDAHRNGRESSEYIGSATERTSLAFAESLGQMQHALRKKWHTRDSLNFSSQWKYRATLVNHPTNPSQYLFATGAPDILLKRSSQALNAQNAPEHITTQRRRELEEHIAHLGSQGYRLLAVAVRRNLSQTSITHDDVHDLLFLGVLTIQDPIRSEVKDAIASTQAAGVSIKLITGDHIETARAVARKVGLPASRDVICEGALLEQMNDAELSEAIDTITIFSRVEPLDKQRIVRILQEKGHIVAMTGDGVNDAVALKGADIGVAMGSGTDIAKDASDLILLNNSFATIVAAIKEGRVLRDNIRKVIAYLLATNAAEVAIFFVSVLSGMPLPLLPAQILWINLVTDGTSDLALSLEPAEHDVMKRKPEDPKASLMSSRQTFIHIIIPGILMTIGTMTLFWYLLRVQGSDLAYARTMAFTVLSVSSLLSVWSYQSLKHRFDIRTMLRNKWIFASAGFSFALQVLAIYLPATQSFFGTVSLGLSDWIFVIGFACITVLAVESRKLWQNRLTPHIS